MSGSYDRPVRRPPFPQPQAPEFPGYDDAMTQPSGSAPGYDPYAPYPEYPVEPIENEITQRPMPPPAQRQRFEAPAPDREIYAPARTKKTDRAQGSAPVVPPGSVTSRSLTLVVSIMCFLACLTAGAVYLINQSADSWLKDVASEVTIQVEARDKSGIEKTLQDVAAFIEKQPGIRKAKPLSLDDSASLLEPWLGKSDALKSLPVPRMIAVEVERGGVAPNFDAMRTALDKQFKGVTLDDHRRWQNQIRAVTRSFALGGIAILLLVAAATTAIIVSATRSSMASNREIVEVLHFVGATDRFIAREFERHFLRLGIRAGLVGALCAALVFFGIPWIMEMLGGGQVSITEMQRLIGAGALDASGYVLLAIVVVVIAALCMLTSRFGVYRILNSRT